MISTGLISSGDRKVDIDEVSVNNLQKRLRFSEAFQGSESSFRKPLSQLNMENDDAPIFRYIYRNFRPRRHLEFGTWEGSGVVACLEECDATVWTLNLFEGEFKATQDFAYGHKLQNNEAVPSWSHKRVFTDPVEGTITYYQTDSFGFIGRQYREKNLGHRVCQIYCDSRDWDVSQYPKNFFDTILIDGGHTKEIVENDTRKALTVLRPGGLIIWHDYCPAEELNVEGSSTQGVTRAIDELQPLLRGALSDLFWINPSWMLVGKKRSGMLSESVRKIFSVMTTI
jgi:hypothetical protein